MRQWFGTWCWSARYVRKKDVAMRPEGKLTPEPRRPSSRPGLAGGAGSLARQQQDGKDQDLAASRQRRDAERQVRDGEEQVRHAGEFGSLGQRGSAGDRLQGLRLGMQETRQTLQEFGQA